MACHVGLAHAGAVALAQWNFCRVRLFGPLTICAGHTCRLCADLCVALAFMRNAHAMPSVTTFRKEVRCRKALCNELCMLWCSWPCAFRDAHVDLCPADGMATADSRRGRSRNGGLRRLCTSVRQPCRAVQLSQVHCGHARCCRTRPRAIPPHTRKCKVQLRTTTIKRKDLGTCNLRPTRSGPRCRSGQVEQLSGRGLPARGLCHGHSAWWRCGVARAGRFRREGSDRIPRRQNAITRAADSARPYKRKLWTHARFCWLCVPTMCARRPPEDWIASPHMASRSLTPSQLVGHHRT